MGAIKTDAATREIIAAHALFVAILGLTDDGKADVDLDSINGLALIGRDKTAALMDIMHDQNSQGRG